MITNRAFSNYTLQQLIEAVTNGDRPIVDDIVPESYKQLIERCWSQDPKDRQTFNEIADELQKEKCKNKRVKKKIIKSTSNSIGKYAFCDCNLLRKITKSSSVTFIGNHSFSGCSSLEQITIPSSIALIGNYSFFGCSSLTKITIPDFVTTIGNYAFSEC